MKRSIKVLGWTLGSAALITAGLGCSHEGRPAQPPTGTSSPPFESNVPTPGTPAPSSGTAKEQPPAPPEQENAPLPPSGSAGPATPAPEMGAPPGAPAPGAAGGNESEHHLCDALANDAKLHVEDVQHGAAIVAVPRTGHDISAIRDDSHRIESTLRQHGAEGPGPEACGLFAIGRLPSVSVSVTEGANSMRIVMTTSNPAEVRDLRRIAREQVSSMKTPSRGR
jgi:hypothetical protein